MNYGKFLGSIGSLSKLSLALVISNVLLSISALVFVISYSQREVVTRIIPAGMTTEAEISSTEANADYKRSIALYIATMSSNLHPMTAIKVVDDMAMFFAPSIYQDYRTFALSVINDPLLKQANVVTIFQPKSVSYERSTDRVFVQGTQQLKGSGVDRTVDLVFEMSIGIAQGRPVVTYLKSYQGSIPETLRQHMNKFKGDSANLPEQIRPLEFRSKTPDQEAQEIVEERGEVDVYLPKVKID